MGELNINNNNIMSSEEPNKFLERLIKRDGNNAEEEREKEKEKEKAKYIE